MKVSELIMRSQELFDSDLVTSDVNAANREKWVRAVQILGDRWLLAKVMKREECEAIKPINLLETA